MIINNGTSWYLRNELKHSGHWLPSSWLAPKGAVFFNWLYSPRRNLRLFTWSFCTWYLNEPRQEKVFPQHLTVPGHFVSLTTYSLHPSSFFFSSPMTCLFLAEGNNWSLYISLKNVLRESDERSKHSLLGDHFINSHNLISWQFIGIIRRKLMSVTIGT